MEFLDCLKNCDRIYKESTDSKFLRKNYRRYFNLKNDKNKNIIVVQYTMVHYVHFRSNHVNINKNNIDQSP